ncbi:MAG: PorP/SprF family type IX secretion system membrane protein [Saprospiraceae bacterium]|nr:PorP/SprF family type IX secretion system membrane protein [Saprospiraceae bacterium]MDW8484347.1 PorP/SprF family type IX secretion system membrane protein [Saprospiraceae bacterium]
MLQKRLLAWFCGMFVISFILKGQDPRFSQFYASPWNLNPALTGAFEGRWRVVANYRDQWSSVMAPVPFRTYSAAADVRFGINASDYFAVGIGALHDEAGTARFSQNKALLGGALLKQVSGRPRRASHVLSVGAQLGFSQNSADWRRVWFSRQFNPVREEPDFNAPSGEPNVRANSDMYLDFHAGLLWYMVFPRNRGFWTAGMAWHHLNRPNVSLLADNPAERLYMRWTLHANGLLSLTSQMGLMPGLLFLSQGPARELNAGAALRYFNGDRHELAMRVGIWARVVNRLQRGLHTDAWIAAVTLELERWMVGLSYDFTTSSLARFNNSRGAFEVSLSYFHPAVRSSRIACPRF